MCILKSLRTKTKGMLNKVTENQELKLIRNKVK